MIQAVDHPVGARDAHFAQRFVEPLGFAREEVDAVKVFPTQAASAAVKVPVEEDRAAVTVIQIFAIPNAIGGAQFMSILRTAPPVEWPQATNTYPSWKTGVSRVLRRLGNEGGGPKRPARLDIDANHRLLRQRDHLPRTAVGDNQRGAVRGRMLDLGIGPHGFSAALVSATTRPFEPPGMHKTLSPSTITFSASPQIPYPASNAAWFRFWREPA